MVGVRININLLEGRIEVALDQAPHLLRLEIIGVVIAGGQHIGAIEDAPLHLGAEAGRARVLKSETTSLPGSRNP